MGCVCGSQSAHKQQSKYAPQPYWQSEAECHADCRNAQPEWTPSGELLGGGRITDEDAQWIASALADPSVCGHVVKLNLLHNFIGDAGSRYLPFLKNVCIS